MTLLSSFSFSMIEEYPCEIRAEEISLTEIKEKIKKGEIDFKIGHSSFAEVLSQMLDFKIEAIREKIKLKKGETVIIAQIFGSTRLPEGKILTSEEIRNLEIKFIQISLK